MAQRGQTQLLGWIDIKLAKRLKRRLITEDMSYRAWLEARIREYLDGDTGGKK